MQLATSWAAACSRRRTPSAPAHTARAKALRGVPTSQNSARTDGSLTHTRGSYQEFIHGRIHVQPSKAELQGLSDSNFSWVVLFSRGTPPKKKKCKRALLHPQVGFLEGNPQTLHAQTLGRSFPTCRFPETGPLVNQQARVKKGGFKWNDPKRNHPNSWLPSSGMPDFRFIPPTPGLQSHQAETSAKGSRPEPHKIAGCDQRHRGVQRE